MRNLGKGCYLLQKESTLVEKKVNGAQIKPFIACGTEEKISEKKLKTLYLLVPSIHQAV